MTFSDMDGGFSYILSLVACFDQWFVLCEEDLCRVHPIFVFRLLVCLFSFFFAINVEVFSLSHRIIKAELPSDQQDFWNCHNGYNDNRQE